MQTYQVANTNLHASRIAYGCMQIGGGWDRNPLTRDDIKAGIDVVATAFDSGINLFDHADIYKLGKSEALFAHVWPALPGLRDAIILQSKCGIRFSDDPRPGAPQRYDFSYDHIVGSVEGSLRRLDTDHLDILLLHRPDPLVEPQEVARAFDTLHNSGKVRYFGVSNHTAGQIALLQHYVDQPLVANQVELSLLHPHLINEGVVANRTDGTMALATATLDYCRLHQILVQAYSPVAGGLLLAAPPDAPDNVRQASLLIRQMAGARGVSPEAIVLAWLLRHPAGIQPIIGTTRPERIRASCQADQVELTREEWYQLFLAARGRPLP